MILSIDLGTTGNRVIVFDKNAKIVSKKYNEFKQIYPKAGWVEHDANEIFESVLELLSETFKEIPKEHIKAIGITNQRETIVCWDEEKTLYNAIVWQDCRTEKYCEELKKDKELKEYIKLNTGLEIDPYFSGSKIKWLMDNIEGIKYFGTIDTWIIYKLTGKFVTDHTNASRTMLYNIRKNKWDDKLLKLFSVKKKMLPKIVNSSEIIGKYKGITISGIVGDQQGALFGQRCFSKGEVKNTYGTGCFCLMNTDNEIKRKKGLLTTIGISLPGKIQYAIEGSVFIGGAIVQWMRDELNLIKDANETEKISNEIKDTNGCYIVPAFAGLGSPYWNSQVRGAIFGLTRGVNNKHIIRAGLESIAYQSKDLIDEMGSIEFLKADGGATKNKFLMQFQADILGKKVIVPLVEETTALGSAFLAGLAVGFWKDIDEIKKIEIESKEFMPEMFSGKREELINGWKKYVNQLIK